MLVEILSTWSKKENTVGCGLPDLHITLEERDIPLETRRSADTELGLCQMEQRRVVGRPLKQHTLTNILREGRSFSVCYISIRSREGLKRVWLFYESKRENG